jgi:hypothetical protein
MIASPRLDEERLLRSDFLDSPSDVTIGQPALGYDLQGDNVDASLSVPVDMHVRGLVICRVDHEAHAMHAKNSDHNQE